MNKSGNLDVTSKKMIADNQDKDGIASGKLN